MKKLAIIGLALLLGAMTGCKGKKKAEVVDPRVLVTVAPAVEAMVDQTAEFTGTIEPFQQNAITPSIPVRIDAILVEVGDRVQKGQLLVRMDPTQYRQAAVQLANLEADYQRMKAVYEAGGIPKQQLDQQATQVEVSRTQVANLKENIELRSPIAGVVTGRYYDPGDMYSSTPKDGKSGVLTVMQIDKLKIQAHVSEQYFPSIKPGMPVEIRAELFPDKIFPGKVTLIYPAIDATTKTFTTEITIPNGALTLRPGMFSRVTFNLGTANRVMIPDLALQKQVGSNERFVYTVKDSIATRQTVQVGRQIGDRYELLGGVENGQEVVTSGASRLMDQSVVKVVE